MMNSDITLVLGGARSGKSSFAEKFAQKSGLKQIYIATAEALDDEMRVRIQHHINDRGDQWETIEEPINIHDKIEEISNTGNIILIDCLTLWLSNIMAQEFDIEKMFQDLISSLKKAKGPIVIVSNEVGLGIVPSNPLARGFRDQAGRLNQQIAKISDNVFFTAAGLPLALKRNGKEVFEL